MQDITYRMTCREGTFTHTVTLPPKPVDVTESLPDWTRLEYRQCKGCQWQASDRCPVAVAMIEPVRILDMLISHEEVRVLVETPERSYGKTTSAQEALSSLFGLVMATSGCPAFEAFKGLAWFHLPFASFEETMFRVTSGYLFRQYLLHRPQPAEEQLITDIKAIYKTVGEVNRGIVDRIKAGAVPQHDSQLNAVILLNSIGEIVTMSVEDGLKEIESHFI